MKIYNSVFSNNQVVFVGLMAMPRTPITPSPDDDPEYTEAELGSGVDASLLPPG